MELCPRETKTRKSTSRPRLPPTTTTTPSPPRPLTPWAPTGSGGWPHGVLSGEASSFFPFFFFFCPNFQTVCSHREGRGHAVHVRMATPLRHTSSMALHSVTEGGVQPPLHPLLPHPPHHPPSAPGVLCTSEPGSRTCMLTECTRRDIGL